jgi:NADH dehydrogenase FAD-containing subunit
MSKNPKVLILGGGYAGLMAAARLGRQLAGAEVTLIDARPEMVQRIRLHEVLAGGAPKTLPYARLLARRGARFVQASVESLDPDARRVTARTSTGDRVELGYDVLVLALGSRTATPVPGVAENALRVDDPAELRTAHGRLRSLAASGGRMLILGAGLTGIEAASELAERLPGLQVTLATRGRLSDDWSPDAAGHFARRLRELGVEVKEGTEVEALESGRARVADGGTIDFDLAVWAGGFEALPLAREAGLPTDAAGRVRTTGTLQVPGRPEIFVAGDAAAASDASGDSIRMGCVSALPMGAWTGENVARFVQGREPKPFPFAFVIRCVSLGRRDGLVQFTTWNDVPRPRVWTGRLGAFVKEMICRMTYWVVKGELSTGIRLYHWATPPRRPAPVPAAESPH